MSEADLIVINTIMRCTTRNRRILQPASQTDKEVEPCLASLNRPQRGTPSTSTLNLARRHGHHTYQLHFEEDLYAPLGPLLHGRGGRLRTSPKLLKLYHLGRCLALLQPLERSILSTPR